MEAWLILQDGTRFSGHVKEPVHMEGEVVFTTGQFGYQESITDPSFCDQILVFARAEIGNYGCDQEHEESVIPFVSAVISGKSSWGINGNEGPSMNHWLKKHHVPWGYGFDQRAIVLHLREQGSQWGCITTTEISENELHMPKDFSQKVMEQVTCDELLTHEGKGTSGTVAIWDFGIKANMIRLLKEDWKTILQFPAFSSAQDIKKHEPDVLFLSNGPGDPADYCEKHRPSN